MASSARLGIALIALLASSCSYEYRVRAAFIDGKLAFLIEDDEKTFAPWCLSYFQVSDSTGRTVWQFDSYEAYKEASECGPFSPLVYGQAPAGAKIVVAPQKLKSGELYVINGDGRGILTGAFRYRVKRLIQVEDLEPHSGEAQLALERTWARDRQTPSLEPDQMPR